MGETLSDNGRQVPERATGIERIVRATGYSLAGLKHAITREPAFRQEFALTCLLVPLALLLPVSRVLQLILVLANLAVLVVELLNTAIEVTVDRGGLGYHDLARQAKDMGSAAVLLSLLCLALCWVVALAEILAS